MQPLVKSRFLSKFSVVFLVMVLGSVAGVGGQEAIGLPVAPIPGKPATPGRPAGTFGPTDVGSVGDVGTVGTPGFIPGLPRPPLPPDPPKAPEAPGNPPDPNQPQNPSNPAENPNGVTAAPPSTLTNGITNALTPPNGNTDVIANPGTVSNPPGSNPPGSNPAGSNPPGSNPTDSNPPGTQPADPTNNQANNPTEGNKDAKSMNTVAVIVGAVIGSLVFILLGIGLFLLYKRRRNSEEQSVLEDPEKATSSPRPPILSAIPREDQAAAENNRMRSVSQMSIESEPIMNDAHSAEFDTNVDADSSHSHSDGYSWLDNRDASGNLLKTGAAVAIGAGVGATTVAVISRSKSSEQQESDPNQDSSMNQTENPEVSSDIDAYEIASDESVKSIKTQSPPMPTTDQSRDLPEIPIEHKMELDDSLVKGSLVAAAVGATAGAVALSSGKSEDDISPEEPQQGEVDPQTSTMLRTETPNPTSPVPDVDQSRDLPEPPTENDAESKDSASKDSLVAAAVGTSIGAVALGSKKGDVTPEDSQAMDVLSDDGSDELCLDDVINSEHEETISDEPVDQSVAYIPMEHDEAMQLATASSENPEIQTRERADSVDDVQSMYPEHQGDVTHRSSILHDEASSIDLDESQEYEEETVHLDGVIAGVDDSGNIAEAGPNQEAILEGKNVEENEPEVTAFEAFSFTENQIAEENVKNMDSKPLWSSKNLLATQNLPE